jgi:hypothetical protein
MPAGAVAVVKASNDDHIVGTNLRAMLHFDVRGALNAIVIQPNLA